MQYVLVHISTCYHENKSFFNDSIFNDFPLSVFITSVRGRELSATALITVRKSPQHPEIGALMAMYNRWKKEKKNKNKTYDRENTCFKKKTCDRKKTSDRKIQLTEKSMW